MHPRARELIGLLDLVPHVEGGHYRRTHVAQRQFRDGERQRPLASAIHYLLAAGELSRWHRIDADEAWHHVEGDALELSIFDAEVNALVRRRLGRPDAHGTCPLIVVPAGCWQAARPLGDYALVGCSVAPAFEPTGFALLADDPGAAAILSRHWPEASALL